MNMAINAAASVAPTQNLDKGLPRGVRVVYL
jgi:hypothetical protein